MSVPRCRYTFERRRRLRRAIRLRRRRQARRLGMVAGSLAVLVVSIVLLFANLPILDPLLSIGITLYVLFNVFRNAVSGSDTGASAL